jgi:hypothetical protein
MNTGITSTVSELSRSRPAAESSNKPGLRTAMRNAIARARSWLGKLVSFAFARVLLIFVVGFAAGMAWQSYGGAARKTVAGWSPRLAWVAPAPPAPGGAPADRLRAMSLALAAARQSLDKVGTEMSKLQDEGDPPRRRRR